MTRRTFDLFAECADGGVDPFAEGVDPFAECADGGGVLPRAVLNFLGFALRIFQPVDVTANFDFILDDPGLQSFKIHLQFPKALVNVMVDGGWGACRGE